MAIQPYMMDLLTVVQGSSEQEVGVYKLKAPPLSLVSLLSCQPRKKTYLWVQLACRDSSSSRHLPLLKIKLLSWLWDAI